MKRSYLLKEQGSVGPILLAMNKPAYTISEAVIITGLTKIFMGGENS